MTPTQIFKKKKNKTQTPTISPWPFYHFIKLHSISTDWSIYFIITFFQLYKSLWRHKRGKRHRVMVLTLETHWGSDFSNTLSIQARGPTGSNPWSEPKQLTCLKYSMGIQAGTDWEDSSFQERYMWSYIIKETVLILIEEWCKLVLGTAKITEKKDTLLVSLNHW